MSAVSRDAMHDSRLARASSVIDDWDEEFDRGKVGGRAGGPGSGRQTGARCRFRSRLAPCMWPRQALVRFSVPSARGAAPTSAGVGLVMSRVERGVPLGPGGPLAGVTPVILQTGKEN